MNIQDALLRRKSVRAFLDKPVKREVIEQILNAARFAPSGANTQPWQVAVVTGGRKLTIQKRMEAFFYGKRLTNHPLLFFL